MHINKNMLEDGKQRQPVAVLFLHYTNWLINKVAEKIPKQQSMNLTVGMKKNPESVWRINYLDTVSALSAMTVVLLSAHNQGDL